MKFDWTRIAAQSHGRIPLLNVGTGSDLSIESLAKLIWQVVGFNGHIEWDTSKPDGTPQKLLDISKMSGLGWQASTPLSQGLARVYVDFQRALISA